MTYFRNYEVTANESNIPGKFWSYNIWTFGYY
jgi:hypothetical protein